MYLCLWFLQTLLPIPLHQLSITIGDFDQDHRIDLVFVNYLIESIGIYLGIGNGPFSKYSELTMIGNNQPDTVMVVDIY